MKRNCNLELRLVTPSMLDLNDDKQQLTIFYNGKMACCDATELQARAIISLASREAEEKSSRNLPAMNSPVYSAATGLSMKRSLKRFLEKRKSRAQTISPYSITRQ